MTKEVNTGTPLPEEICTMEEFYQRYLPKHATQYPITMRVTEAERDLIMKMRGDYYDKGRG